MRSREASFSPADKPGGSGGQEKSDIQKAFEDVGAYKGYIFLLTPDEFANVMDGTELISIVGERLIKGEDNFSDHAQGGYLAYGFPQEKVPNWLPQDDKRRRPTTLQQIEGINQAVLESPKLADHLWINRKPLPIFEQKIAGLFFLADEDVKGQTSITLNGQTLSLQPSTKYDGFVEIVGLTRVAAIFAVRAHDRAFRSATMG